MAPTIIGIVAFVVVVSFLLWGVPKPPEAESEQDLLSQGYSVKEAKREARAQRSEARSHKRLQSDALRTGARVGNFARKLAKPPRRRRY